MLHSTSMQGRSFDGHRVMFFLLIVRMTCAVSMTDLHSLPSLTNITQNIKDPGSFYCWDPLIFLFSVLMAFHLSDLMVPCAVNTLDQITIKSCMYCTYLLQMLHIKPGKALQSADRFMESESFV